MSALGVIPGVTPDICMFFLTASTRWLGSTGFGAMEQAMRRRT